jgi:putative sigma-54 modulation protein
VSPLLRQRVEGKLRKLARVPVKIVEARVVLSQERHRAVAEVTLLVKGAILHAEAASDDSYSAVDRAIVSVRRQVRRRHDRLQGHKPRPVRAAPPGAPRSAPAWGEEEFEPEVIVRRVSTKPMSIDEAVEALRAGHDPVLVFTNARTHALNVLRRRPSGRLELVQPSG